MADRRVTPTGCLMKLLEAERRRRDLSYGETAEALGVSQGTYSNWRKGTHRPDPSIYAKIAEFLGLRHEDVVGVLLSEELANAQAEDLPTRVIRAICIQCEIGALMATDGYQLLRELLEWADKHYQSPSRPQS